MKRLLTSLLLTCLMLNAWGHALWIQTSPVGKKGKKQAVRITYAEPDEAPEKINDWYSDVKAFELWLISPDGQKTKLAVTPAENHYTADFTPQQEGVYTLAVGHAAKELGGTTKYQFNATAAVTVGQAKSTTIASPNELNVTVSQANNKYKVGQPIALAGVFKTKPSDKLQIAVHSPSGWNRTVQTKADGQAEFTPLWPGTYYIEASKTEKESGEQDGKPYKSVWRCATYIVEVEKP
ncbi:DUF4198 domain-containing protein [Runella limosa]|uniref:DUF4198 domain-containing protein n=1 Tax=Runella limosa TaxID=370978 RepID=UPI000562C107|nr:DUF4198 domain-containing protein [Runella limosa]